MNVQSGAFELELKKRAGKTDGNLVFPSENGGYIDSGNYNRKFYSCLHVIKDELIRRFAYIRSG